MLDTLMVLCMKGSRRPVLRALIMFLVLCAGICTLLLLITISGVKWPGVVATASSVQGASHGPVAAPTPIDSAIPIILQNPSVASPTATLTATPEVTHVFNKGHISTPPPTSAVPSPTQDPNPSLIRSILGI
ncbi:MAG: hypothetical protein ABI234_00965 [Ktedonobacteraceae bacterium]